MVYNLIFMIFNLNINQIIIRNSIANLKILVGNSMT